MAARRTRSAGQALIETTVLALYILVPLLLWGPTLGKYVSGAIRIDQVGTELAWERTVWNDEDMPQHESLDSDSGYREEKLAQRSGDKIRDFVLGAHAGKRADLLVQEEGLNFSRPYWRYGSNSEPIFETDSTDAGSHDVSTLGYEVVGVYNRVAQGVKKIPLLGEALGQFGEINHSLGSRVAGEITINTNPLSPSDNITLSAGRLTEPFEQKVHFRSQGELITRQWSAQDTTHFRQRTADFIPASLIQGSDAFDLLMDTLSLKTPEIDAFIVKVPSISLGTSIKPLKEELGAIDVSPVPDGAPNCRYGAAKSGKGKKKKKSKAGKSAKSFGLCRFERASE